MAFISTFVISMLFSQLVFVCHCNPTCKLEYPIDEIPVYKEDRYYVHFAQNLEFLEAEYFLWSSYGYGLWCNGTMFNQGRTPSDWWPKGKSWSIHTQYYQGICQWRNWSSKVLLNSILIDVFLVIFQKVFYFLRKRGILCSNRTKVLMWITQESKLICFIKRRYQWTFTKWFYGIQSIILIVEYHWEIEIRVIKGFTMIISRMEWVNHSNLFGW